jgi:hypothetical protein
MPLIGTDVFCCPLRVSPDSILFFAAGPAAMSWHFVHSEVVEAEQPALQAEDDPQRFKRPREVIAELLRSVEIKMKSRH